MNCPHCTAVLPDDDIFCEECGIRLTDEAAPIAPLCACGAPDGELDEDGYCIHCGRRCRALPGEHEETQISIHFAAVSDRGLRHPRNEDRFQIVELSGLTIAVVCDGVSNSTNAEAAATAASTCIVEALAAGKGMEDAVSAARESVAQLAHKAAVSSAPSTTAVAAMIENKVAQIAWMGDSRAYWISPAGSRQLTKDHSWMNDVVSSGELSYAEASHAPQAHGITRWIGADSGSEMRPDFATFEIPGPGWLLLCTDGLWNYAPEVEQMAALLLEMSSETTALERARALVAFANDKGGSDNITAALLQFTD